MIALSSMTSDLNGFVLIKESPNSTYPDFTRRVSRTATLDGKSSVNDSGFSEGDMTFVINVDEITKPDIVTIEYLVKNYSLVRISTPIGAFEGVISRVQSSKLPINITLLITKQI